MRVGVYINRFKDKDNIVTQKLCELLDKYAIEPVLSESDGEFFDKSDLPLDYMITIGGDGTILRVADFCAVHSIPILGINLGMLGFLSEIKIEEFESVIEKLKKKEYTLDRRSMINVKLDKEYYALNDIVVIRENTSKMLKLKVKVDGNLLDEFRCDGYIVSTPTGSTAYSLSAGGSVISPAASVIALTPINAHTLHTKPIIAGSQECVEITNLSDFNAIIVVDGQRAGSIAQNESAKIYGAPISTLFVRFSSLNFYTRLLYKLNAWTEFKE